MNSSRQRSHAVRRPLAVAIFSFGIAAVGFLIKEDLYRFFDVDPRLLLLVIGLLFLQGVAVLLLLYLRGDLSLPVVDRFLDLRESDRALQSSTAEVQKRAEIETALAGFRKDLTDLQARMAASPTDRGIAPLETERVLESLRKHVNENLATELEGRVEDRVRSDVHAARVRQVLESASLRLRKEIASLTRRGNVNLVIGVVTTTIAVSLLAYMVLTVAGTFDTWTHLLSHYIPRITVVVFIEVFSFFFLRLYRASLAEIKYYQNELTTFDAQNIALEAANTANVGTRSAVISAIGRIDKNRTESDLSKRGFDSAQLKDAADLVDQLAKVASSILRRADSNGTA